MTPKEKAKELVDKFEWYCEEVMEYQKACALIAVDELIEATSMRYEFRNGEIVEIGKKPLQYWLDVKNEIENL